jgi:hypothetical protein
MKDVAFVQPILSGFPTPFERRLILEVTLTPEQAVKLYGGAEHAFKRSRVLKIGRHSARTLVVRASFLGQGNSVTLRVEALITDGDLSIHNGKSGWWVHDGLSLYFDYADTKPLKELT